uniref:Phytocyanin domain-containing protein n=1 Tax=Leersia perrieri TaxID=77586 RepID=A0A0D9X473_9ORYZ
MMSLERMSLLAVVVVAAAFTTVSGASYGVGEPNGGWDMQTNYTAWASSINFHLGDQLVFKYSPAAHDVVEVTKAGYDACSAASPVAIHRTGQDAVELNRLGSRYFICGVPGHCNAGMKLQVRTRCGSALPPGGGVCLDGSSPPTIISSPGVISYSSSPASSGIFSTVIVTMAATTVILILLMV